MNPKLFGVGVTAMLLVGLMAIVPSVSAEELVAVQVFDVLPDGTIVESTQYWKESEISQNIKERADKIIEEWGAGDNDDVPLSDLLPSDSDNDLFDDAIAASGSGLVADVHWDGVGYTTGAGLIEADY